MVCDVAKVVRSAAWFRLKGMLVPRTNMDRSCAATILSAVEQASNPGAPRLLQKIQAITQGFFRFRYR